MSDWDRRHLLGMVDKIRNRLEDQAITPAQREELGMILNIANKLSKSIVADRAAVNRVLAALCEVCGQGACRCIGRLSTRLGCEFLPDSE